MEPENENLNSEIEEQVDIDTSTDEDVEVVEEETEEKEEYTDRERQLYARLKKAEADLKEAAKAPKATPKAATGELSATDIIALSKANIETDDIDEVLSYAKYRKINVAQALKDPTLTAILSTKAEERKSAVAIAAPGRRAPSSALSDERLLANAAQGILPESDADLKRLFDLRRKK